MLLLVVDGVVVEHEVPAVGAVLAAVGDDIARLELEVSRRRPEQVAAPSAVHADDGGLGAHAGSVGQAAW